MEALAAVGLASNVVQFVQFSCELLSKAREIRHSAHGNLKEHLELDTIAKHLKSHTDQLEVNVTQGSSLYDILHQCRNIAIELSSAIQTLQNGAPGKRRKWQSFKDALRTVWKEKKITELQARLENLRSELILHLSISTGTTQARLLEIVEKHRQTRDEDDQTVKIELQNLSNTLSSVKERLSTLQQGDTLDEVLKTLRELSERSKEIASDGIIDSLYFECMDVRHAAISEAHARTFDWIFRPKAFPAGDRRSEIRYKSWLQTGESIYWITGKPGAGKSTLMKYLDGNIATSQALDRWAGSTRLVRASFYFWNAGTPMQKSLQGLLQSLLYTILDSCPDLVPIVCPQRWETIRSSRSWSVSELKSAFEVLTTQTSIDRKFYFHVDGLDEYAGDHYEVIDMLRALSKCSNVKLCVSSRPWNCFQDEYGKSRDHMLELHHLTREDIELCAKESIESHCQSTHDLSSLVKEIGERAQGVFLWVRLVIRSLRDGLVNDDDIELLQERLQVLPTDLEDFFKHILLSVHSVYQERMACTFLAALSSDESLNIIHYSFLDQRNPHRSEDLKFPYRPFDSDTISKMVTQTQRRLNGRYKGLLEPSDTEEEICARTTVDFLHRTLRDFLKKPSIQELLLSKVPVSFSPYAALSRAFLDEAKYLTDSQDPSQFGRAMRLARHASEQTKTTDFEYAILGHVELIGQEIWQTHMSLVAHPENFLIKTAIHIGKIDFLRHRLRKHVAVDSINRLLVHAVLCPHVAEEAHMEASVQSGLMRADRCFTIKECLSDVPNLNAEIVESILGLGADPNALVTKGTIWRNFLAVFLESGVEFSKESFYQVFLLLLRHGANAKDHVDVWTNFLANTAASKDNGEIMQATLQMFSALFRHGLSPNARTEYGTIFQTLLNNTMLALPYATRNSARQDLLELFLSHGARVAHIYQAQGTRYCWFLRVIERLQRDEDWKAINPVAYFEVMLRYGLDPNVEVKEYTLWEHLLETFTIASKYSNPEDSEDSNTKIELYSEIILLFLQYGADPFSNKLDALVGWMKRNGRYSTHSQTRIIDQTLQQERNQNTSMGCSAVQQLTTGSKKRGSDTSFRALDNCSARVHEGKRLRRM
ncbi:hypothetical protein BDV96DRAFT_112563 [Lophiotrema nucula]|uniref:Uncharacterized protein n=1 Tax=Lophiotrema nucula TaxID=690887 RepID=A0A6A5Z794_9PLEO|nr:hypothetical protein BDV96DRAFT_112563 [Lophiotrema nucula]